jgi:DDE superfamily endonuclease
LKRFDQDTRQKGGRRRLLLVDGHFSHVNMAFLTLANSLRILVLILPPHSIHRLQPLDVGLFLPLSTAYSKALNTYTHGGLGWVSMTKRMFWSLFREAWSCSYTEKNIKSAFSKTGIWPFDPKATISQLQSAPAQPLTPCRVTAPLSITPLTVRGLCRLIKSDPTQQKMEVLERAVLRLAAKFEIQSHENQGLKAAITQEKKRRRRGRRLNLLGEEDTAGPQFFSPQRILAAKAFQEGKEAAEHEKKHQKAIDKEQATLKRQEKQAEQQEHTIQRQLRQQAVKEEKEKKKAE